MIKNLLSAISFVVLIISHVESSEIEDIEKYYRSGMEKVDYSISNGINLYKEAYFDFKKSADLGDIRSLYYIGYLHELAAYNGFSFDKNMSKIEHLSCASKYYGIGVEKNIPQAADALSRVTVEAIEESKKLEELKKNNGFLNYYIPNILGWS